VPGCILRTIQTQLAGYPPIVTFSKQVLQAAAGIDGLLGETLVAVAMAWTIKRLLAPGHAQSDVLFSTADEAL
jgi:hypothetical protein